MLADSKYSIYFYLQVLLLVKGALLEDPRLIEDEEEEKKNPMGLMHITSLRLADIFSDDSNFRNLVMDQIVRECFISLSSDRCFCFRRIKLLVSVREVLDWDFCSSLDLQASICPKSLELHCFPWMCERVII